MGPVCIAGFNQTRGGVRFGHLCIAGLNQLHPPFFFPTLSPLSPSVCLPFSSVPHLPHCPHLSAPLQSAWSVQRAPSLVSLLTAPSFCPLSPNTDITHSPTLLSSVCLFAVCMERQTGAITCPAPSFCPLSPNTDVTHFPTLLPPSAFSQSAWSVKQAPSLASTLTLTPPPSSTCRSSR